MTFNVGDQVEVISDRCPEYDDRFHYIEVGTRCEVLSVWPNVAPRTVYDIRPIDGDTGFLQGVYDCHIRKIEG